MHSENLSAKQLAFFINRITGETAKREWAEHIRAAIETLLETPLGRITTSAAIIRLTENVTTKQSYNTMIGPISKAIHAAVVADLRNEKTLVGHYVPLTARKKIDELLTKPNLVSEKLLRRVLEQEAMEETMRDVLFEALTEFNNRVNPFVADWGLPGIMKKLGPFGLGPIAKSIDSVRAEFDKRMEPEMRKFLQSFSRKALNKTGDLMAKNADSPSFIELRKAIVAWIYEQPMREFMVGIDDEGAALTHDAAMEIGKHTSTLADFKSRQKTVIEDFFAKHERDSLRAILAEYDATFEIDLDAFAEATWPAIVTVLQSEPVRVQIKKFLDEFWESVGPTEIVD